jgi:hypothetical protein
MRLRIARPPIRCSCPSLKHSFLIALAIDIAKNSERGIKSLATQALASGATKKEITETLRIAHYLCGVGSMYTAAAALKVDYKKSLERLQDRYYHQHQALTASDDRFGEGPRPSATVCASFTVCAARSFTSSPSRIMGGGKRT